MPTTPDIAEHTRAFVPDHVPPAERRTSLKFGRSMSTSDHSPHHVQGEIIFGACIVREDKLIGALAPSAVHPSRLCSSAEAGNVHVGYLCNVTAEVG